MKTILDLMIEYADYLLSLQYSPETVRKTLDNLKQFDRWIKKTYQIETINRLLPDHLKKWHGHLTTLRTQKGYPLKVTAINRKIVAVRGFIKYAADSGYIHHRCINNLPYLKEPKRLPGSVLAHIQVKKLLSKISTNTTEGYRDRAMFELLYSTGVRAGELLKIDVQDICFKNHSALVNGKGNKQRMVPIGKTALRYLESYVVAVRPYLVKDRTQTAMFLGRDGRRLSYQIFRRIVLAVVERSGLDVPVTAHTFRRSCTTELIRGGANIYHVKELLGHESLDTLKPYIQLTIVDLKKTHEKCHPREIDKR